MEAQLGGSTWRLKRLNFSVLRGLTRRLKRRNLRDLRLNLEALRLNLKSHEA